MRAPYTKNCLLLRVIVCAFCRLPFLNVPLLQSAISNRNLSHENKYISLFFLFPRSLSIINIVIVITFIRFRWRRVYFLFLFFPTPLRWNREGSQTNNTTKTMTHTHKKRNNIYEVIAVVPLASVCIAKLRWVSIEKSHTTHSGNIVRLSFCGYLFIVIVSDGHGIVRGLRAPAIKEKINRKVLDGHIA